MNYQEVGPDTFLKSCTWKPASSDHCPHSLSMDSRGLAKTNSWLWRIQMQGRKAAFLSNVNWSTQAEWRLSKSKFYIPGIMLRNQNWLIILQLSAHWSWENAMYCKPIKTKIRDIARFLSDLGTCLFEFWVPIRILPRTSTQSHPGDRNV